MGESCIIGFEKLHEGCVAENSWLVGPLLCRPECHVTDMTLDYSRHGSSSSGGDSETIDKSLRCSGSNVSLFFSIEGMN
jgi:hypothetical protein